MGQTPIHKIPYPEADDKPDGPVQMKALAEATERELIVHDGQISNLSAVRVAFATSTQQRSNLLGWQILPVPVVFPASSTRQYKVECGWQMSAASTVIVHTRALWRPGTQPSLTDGVNIHYPQDTATTAGWQYAKRCATPPVLIPFDGTVCVFALTYANGGAGAVQYNDIPNGEVPDYLAVYDIGPKP